MSCWRTYTCDVLKNVDKAIVIEALAKMGISLNESKKIVSGRYERKSSPCDGVLVTRDRGDIDVGIIFADDTSHLKLVGDFWETGLDVMTFQDELSREYQRINILTQAELNGWTLDESTLEESTDGSIEFELYQYA